MDLLTHLLIISTFDLIFVGECRLVYIYQNLTFIGAWKRCHEEYKGHLADLDKWTDSSQTLQSHCLETDDFFWHGSLTKSFPWISFEGCYRYLNYSKAITMPYTSLAWCQNYCMLYHPKRSSFAVNINQCLCDLYSQYGHPADSQHCSIPCDDNAKCGGNGYISLFKRAQLTTDNVLDFDTPENIDNRCLAFKCVSGTKVIYEAANCADQLPYNCANRSSPFDSTRRESWLISNILCTTTLIPPICKDIEMPSESRRWTKIFRAQFLFKDQASLKMKDLETIFQTPFYTNDREGRRVIFSGGREEYRSLCETDISEEELIDEDSICDNTSGTDIRQVSSTESSMETTSNLINKITNSGLIDTTDQTYLHTESASFGYEFFVIVGVLLVVLIIVIGLVRVYRKVKNTRQIVGVVNVEIEIRTEGGRNISLRHTEADNTLSHSSANTRDDDHSSSTRNLSDYSFARMTDGGRLKCNVEDNLFVYSKARNELKSQIDVSMDSVDTIYNDIEDSCTAEIEMSNLSTAIYMDDGIYEDILPEQSEDEILNG